MTKNNLMKQNVEIRGMSGMSFNGIYSCLDISSNRKYVVTDPKSDLEIFKQQRCINGRIN